MKKMLAVAQSVCLLLALAACNSGSLNKRLEVEREISEYAVQSSSALELLEEPIQDIIADAVSLSYQSNDEWISMDLGSPEAKGFIQNLTALFPERFGELAAAYMPEDIIIKFSLGESAQRNVNVNSSTETIRTVVVSDVEINSSGVVFLLPQGTALGVIREIETVLPAAK